MSIRVLETSLHILNTRTRIPFKFGITTMTRSPQLFVRVVAEIEGDRQVGIAADHLPPKWFTKDPATSFKDDVDEMLKVIETACDVARATPRSASVFAWWRAMHDGMSAWGGGWTKPPLLTHFGTSLLERALLDAFCRLHKLPLARAVREDRLGIDLGAVHRELDGAQPKDLLPGEPLRSIVARHTVGLADPLTDVEIPAAERVDDGLPQSLEAAIRAYGLTHFKVKLVGDVARDVERVRRVADVIEANVKGGDYRHTLDANENFKAVEPFRAFWESLTREPMLSRFLSRLLFVEQPLHRSVALSPEVAKAFAAWQGRPPTIIDESDGELSSCPTALLAGYVGTSHKNCKGVFKGIANACLLAHRRKKNPGVGDAYVLSGEDLANVGPVALLQDLAVVATLGVTHVERNGHHYFRGLSMLPEDLQQTVLKSHHDLYRKHEAGFPTARIEGGRMNIGTLVDAPFGTAFTLDPARFTPREEWTFESL